MSKALTSALLALASLGSMAQSNIAALSVTTGEACMQTDAGRWIKLDCGGEDSPHWSLKDASMTICQAQPTWRDGNHIVKAPFRLMTGELDVGARSLAECQRRGEKAAKTAEKP